MRNKKVHLPPDRIESFCRRWKINLLELFGSALREDLHADSDVDLLVTFEPDAEWSLLDHIQMEEELAGIVGCNVDLVSRKAVEYSRNPIRREGILKQTEIVYESR